MKEMKELEHSHIDCKVVPRAPKSEIAEHRHNFKLVSRRRMTCSWDIPFCQSVYPQRQARTIDADGTGGEDGDFGS